MQSTSSTATIDFDARAEKFTKTTDKCHIYFTRPKQYCAFKECPCRVNCYEPSNGLWPKYPALVATSIVLVLQPQV